MEIDTKDAYQEMLDNRKTALENDFNKQIREFKNNNRGVEFSRFNPRRDKVLVEVFKFIPTDESVSMGKSVLFGISELDGTLKPLSVIKNEKIFPIVKVLKKGTESPDWIEEGSLYIVPYNDVVGETWNPDFQWMMQNFSQKKGDGKPSVVTIPEDMPQKLPKLDVNWERYKFSMPDRLGDEDEGDKLVYLIPSLKIEADYLL